MRASIKYQVILKYKNKYRINEMCKFFEVSRSGYYAFLKRLEIPDRDLELADKIRECPREEIDIAEYIYGLKGKEYIRILKRFYE